MYKRVIYLILPVVFFLLLWEVISRSGAVNIALFPPPSAVVSAFMAMLISGTLVSDIATSLWRLVIALVLGALIGVAVGLVTGRNKTVALMIGPIIQLLRPLPPVAITPLVIVWFGIDNGAKIFSISFAVFFPVWINAHIGSQNIPHAYLWNARLLTSSPWKIFTKVVFPAALPFIATGIRTAIALAFIMVFVSELAGASNGLGYRISITHLAYRIDEMMAALAVLAILGALVDWLFSKSLKSLFPWINSKPV